MLLHRKAEIVTLTQLSSIACRGQQRKISQICLRMWTINFIINKYYILLIICFLENSFLPYDRVWNQDIPFFFSKHDCKELESGFRNQQNQRNTQTSKTNGFTKELA